MDALDKIYAIDIGVKLLARRTPSTIFGASFPEYIRKDMLLWWLVALMESVKKIEKARPQDIELVIFTLNEVKSKIESL